MIRILRQACRAGAGFGASPIAAELSMNSEEQVAVLQQIFPQQGPEPHSRSSYSERPLDVGSTTPLLRNVLTPLAKEANLKRSPMPRCQQAATSPFVSAKVQFANCKVDLNQSTENHPENDGRLARWNTAPQSAADSPCSQASAAPVSPFDAIHKAASTLGSSLAWMGSYITEFVADVAGDDEPTDEEIAEAEKLKQAAKKASMENQGSVTGDLAQPLTRRHSRSNSSVSLNRGMSRGASTRLDGDWDISPKRTLSKHSIHEDDVQSDDDDAKKDS